MLNAPYLHAVNSREKRRGACSYFVFYSEPAGNNFFTFMKDYCRLRSDHILLHIIEIKFRDKLRNQFFIRQKSSPFGGAFT